MYSRSAAPAAVALAIVFSLYGAACDAAPEGPTAEERCEKKYDQCEQDCKDMRGGGPECMEDCEAELDQCLDDAGVDGSSGSSSTSDSTSSSSSDDDDDDTVRGDSSDVGMPQFFDASDSQAVGSPNSGSLINGVMLQSTDNLDVSNTSRAYGTEEMIELLTYASNKVVAEFPGTPPQFVGDISISGGGTLSPHSTHQAGRDVDVSFFLKNNVEPNGLPYGNESNFDIEKNWFYLQTLVDTGIINYILMDIELQELMYVELMTNGVSEAELDEMFQYPSTSNDFSHSYVQHVVSHHDHYHIEIICADDDTNCSDW